MPHLEAIFDMALPRCTLKSFMFVCPRVFYLLKNNSLSLLKSPLNYFWIFILGKCCLSATLHLDTYNQSFFHYIDSKQSHVNCWSFALDINWVNFLFLQVLSNGLLLLCGNLIGCFYLHCTSSGHQVGSIKQFIFVQQARVVASSQILGGGRTVKINDPLAWNTIFCCSS